ncbi:hypothetical protein SLE2022_095060 [Rubroshorea leprosula]
MAMMNDSCLIPQPSICSPHFGESLQLPESLSHHHSKSLQPPLHPISNPESPQPPEGPEPPSHLHSETLHSIPNLDLSQPPEPPFPLHPESLQPPLRTIPNIESPQSPPQPPPSTIDNLESQQVISDVAQQNLQWQNAILAFCLIYVCNRDISSVCKIPIQTVPSLQFGFFCNRAYLCPSLDCKDGQQGAYQGITSVGECCISHCYTTTIPFPVGFKFVI